MDEPSTTTAERPPGLRARLFYGWWIVAASAGIQMLNAALLGYAFDGYPIYGPDGYANANGSGGIVRLRSSYRFRSITQRHTLPDGTRPVSGPGLRECTTSHPVPCRPRGLSPRGTSCTRRCSWCSS